MFYTNNTDDRINTAEEVEVNKIIVVVIIVVDCLMMMSVLQKEKIYNLNWEQHKLWEQQHNNGFTKHK